MFDLAAVARSGGAPWVLEGPNWLLDAKPPFLEQYRRNVLDHGYQDSFVAVTREELGAWHKEAIRVAFEKQPASAYTMAKIAELERHLAEPHTVITPVYYVAQWFQFESGMGD